MPPTILLRRLPGFPGWLLAMALLLSGQREVEIDLRPVPLLWLLTRLNLGPALLLAALFAAGIALGVLLGQHGVSPL